LRNQDGMINCPLRLCGDEYYFLGIILRASF
jgi:hypothetical protein